MNVSGVGGAASLPMTLPSSTSSSVATGPPATSASPATRSTGTSPTGTSTSADGTGEVRLPGEQRTRPTESAHRTKKEVPKPAPLPPLKGLTVAEIRAMLGVAPLPKQTETAGATAGIGGIATATLTAPSRTTAFLQRYA